MIQKILSASLILVSISAFAQLDSRAYEARPLPLVNVAAGEPAAPAVSKTEVCAVPSSQSWADVSVSRIVLESQSTCAAPLKATAEAEALKTTR